VSGWVRFCAREGPDGRGCAHTCSRLVLSRPEQHVLPALRTVARVARHEKEQVLYGPSVHQRVSTGLRSHGRANPASYARAQGDVCESLHAEVLLRCV
jgi:hypothetical protein